MKLSQLAVLDVRYWYILHEICPNCGVNLHGLHPASNICPHWTGDCDPATKAVNEWDRQYREWRDRVPAFWPYGGGQ